MSDDRCFGIIVSKLVPSLLFQPLIDLSLSSVPKALLGMKTRFLNPAINYRAITSAMPTTFLQSQLFLGSCILALGSWFLILGSYHKAKTFEVKKDFKGYIVLVSALDSFVSRLMSSVSRLRKKILQYPLPHLSTFLRMGLHGVEIIPVHQCCKIMDIMGLGNGIFT